MNTKNLLIWIGFFLLGVIVEKILALGIGIYLGVAILLILFKERAVIKPFALSVVEKFTR